MGDMGVIVAFLQSRRGVDGRAPCGGSDEFGGMATQVQALAVAADRLLLVAAGVSGLAIEARMVSWSDSWVCRRFGLTILDDGS